MRLTAVQYIDLVRRETKRLGRDPSSDTDCLAVACILLSEVAPLVSWAYVANLGNEKPARSTKHDIDS